MTGIWNPAKHPTFTFVLCVTFDLLLTTEACKTIATCNSRISTRLCATLLLVGTSSHQTCARMLHACTKYTCSMLITQKWSVQSWWSPVLSDDALASRSDHRIMFQIGHWSLSKYCSFISRPTSPPLFHAIHRWWSLRSSSSLTICVPIHAMTTMAKSWNPFHPAAMMSLFGINCLFIFHPMSC